MIRYALLGLLRDQPDYGYSLRRRFEEHLGPVWRLNSGQVYQGLRYLRRARLIEVVVPAHVAEGPETRDRCVFAPTPKGERALERWLGSPPRTGANTRDETLLRLAVLVSSDRGRAGALIEKRLRVARKRVVLLAGKAPVRGEAATHLTRRIAHEAALRHAEAHVRWLELAAHLLDEGGGNTDPALDEAGPGTDAAA